MEYQKVELNEIEKRLFVQAVCTVAALMDALHRDKDIQETALAAIELDCQRNMDTLADLLDEKGSSSFSYRLAAGAKKHPDEEMTDYANRVLHLLSEADLRVTT